MQNIIINENDNLQEILENISEFPIMINNKMVVLSYDEYINTIKKINPNEAKEIEEDVQYAINENKFLTLFTEEKINLLREYLLDTFKQAKLEDFYSEENIDGMISTVGYYDCLKRTLKDEIYNEFFNWYDSLQWYHSDSFDAEIRTKLIIQKK